MSAKDIAHFSVRNMSIYPVVGHLDKEMFSYNS